MMTRSGRMIGLAAMVVVAVGGIVSAPTQVGAATGSALQAELDRLTHEDGFPGALATVTDASRPGGAARNRTVRSGVGDLNTGRPVPYNGRVRMGSNNKTLVATVVLQLVERGWVDLDAPVERYLPGVVRGNGNDGRTILIRHLLQHRSGLPDYVADLGSTPEELLAGRFRQFSPEELVDLALTHPPTFPSGEPGRWAYSNTGYELLGMVIEKVTGHSWQREMTERIIKPLRLDTMYLPRAREYGLRGPHPRGYLTMSDPGTPLVDITELDPSLLGAGMLVSTPGDYNRFLTALLEGDLLSPGMLAEMMRTVPADLWPDSEYGLGLTRTPLTCGGYTYGHSGDVPGYTTLSGLAVDAAGRTGRSATVALTRIPDSRDEGLHLLKALDTALCDQPKVE